MTSEEAQNWKNRGNEAFSNKDNEEAIKCFTRAIEIDSKNNVFFSNRSAAYAAIGQYDKALEDAQSCVALEPSWAKGYSRLGLALFNLNRLDEAKDAYEKGLGVDPNNASLLEGLEDVKSKIMPRSPFDNLFGPDIWNKIQRDPRLSPFLSDPTFVNNVKMLERDPNQISNLLMDPKIQTLFGALLGINDSNVDRPEGADAEQWSQSSSGRSEETPQDKKMEKHSEPAPSPELSDEENIALSEKEAGNAAYKKRDFAAAMQHYERSLEAQPTNPVPLLNIAAVHLETGNCDEAVSTCQKCIDVCQQQGGHLSVAGKAYGRMGTAYLKSGDLDKAIHSFERSLLENHDRVIEKKLKEAKKAKAKADADAYIDADKSLEHKEKGNSLFQTGDFINAIKEYTESINRNPVDAKVYSNRAACYTKLMDWGNALKDVNKSIELEPSFVKAYIRKGRIEMLLKQYHKARETYLAGLKYDPTCQDLQDGLSEIDRAIQRENSSGTIDPERQARAMNDPEVQKVLADPQMQNILTQMQSDPAAANKALSDPIIRKNIDLLVAAGVLRIA
jgi:stress-induced-phosphoprotein 1